MFAESGWFEVALFVAIVGTAVFVGTIFWLILAKTFGGWHD